MIELRNQGWNGAACFYSCARGCIFRGFDSKPEAKAPAVPCCWRGEEATAAQNWPQVNWPCTMGWWGIMFVSLFDACFSYRFKGARKKYCKLKLKMPTVRMRKACLYAELFHRLDRFNPSGITWLFLWWIMKPPHGRCFGDVRWSCVISYTLLVLSFNLEEEINAFLLHKVVQSVCLHDPFSKVETK